MGVVPRCRRSPWCKPGSRRRQTLSEAGQQDSVRRWEEYYGNLKESYLFPNEFVVRTFLANYPGLDMPHEYQGAKVCDVSCGDGRNLVLLNKLGLELFATELSPAICDVTRRKLLQHNDRISADIVPGVNWELPFEEGFFDYLLSWNAIYYMRDADGDFREHVREHARILKPGGYFVCSVPGPNCFSLAGAEDLGNDLIRVRTDSKWSMLNGTIYRRFRGFADIESTFGECFEDFRRCTIQDDCYGLPLEYLVFVCRKR
jgi:SAM-dependent methyltransferase